MKKLPVFLFLIFLVSGCTTISSVSKDREGNVYVVSNHTRLFIFNSNRVYSCKEDEERSTINCNHLLKVRFR